MRVESASKSRDNLFYFVVFLMMMVAAVLAFDRNAAYAAPLEVTVTNSPYNAVGDGVTNDRTAIQQAIDDVAANIDGGTVYLPGGYTFLSGNLTLKDKVTLNIQANAVLKQSQNTSHYTYTPVLGHDVPNTSIKWNHSMYLNQPFVYAGNVSNVKITGTGYIDMTDAGTHSTTIHLNPIGFYQVDEYEISNITIRYSNAYYISLFTTTNGLVSGVKLTNHGDGNTDGISIMNSQNIRVTGNTLNTVGDDGIYIFSSYDDPRGGTWWSSDIPQPSRNIEIDNNNISVVCCKAVALIPWGAGAPDLSQVEISDISIHDNILNAGESLGCWCDDPYHGEYPFTYNEQTDHVPMKNITFYNNTYNNLIKFDNPVITNLSTDFGRMGPDHFLNAGFESPGMLYWSTAGDSSQSGTANNAVGQDGSRYGYIQNFHLGRAALYEGLGLTDRMTYNFTANVQSSGANARMFVYNACSGTETASKPFSNTTWESKTLTFTANGTCSNYQIGIDNGTTAGSTAWARIDSASLTLNVISDIVDNGESGASYSGTWQTYGNASDVGGNHRTATSGGSSVTVSFNGVQAKLIGIRDSNMGMAKVYVDGVYKTTIDMYKKVYQSQYEMYDTGLLNPGNHTIKLEALWTKNIESSNYYVAFDALMVVTDYSIAVDNGDPAVSYTGTWQTYSSSGDMGGNHRTAKASGSTVTVAFTGNRAALIGIRDYNLGQAKVYVDGVYSTTIDFYNPTPESQYILYDTGVLLYGDHTIKLEAVWTKNSASSGYYIDIDALKVAPSSVIDSIDAAVSYSGTWQQYSWTSDVGGNHRTAMTSGSTVTIPFAGTRAKVLGGRDNNLGQAKVYVDGVYQATIDFYNATPQGQYEMYDTGVLTPGNHTIQLEAKWTKNNASSNYYIDYDALMVIN